MLTITSRMWESRKRLKQAVIGKADCVPVYAQISSHAARLAGQSTRKFYTDAETFLSCQLLADELYQIDSVTNTYDIYNMEAEALGATLVWREGAAPEVDASRPLLESVDDWKKLKPPPAGKAGRMPFALEINQRLVELGLPAKVRFCGVFTLAAKLLGHQKLILACMTEPEKVHSLLSFLTDEVIAPWIIHQRQQCGSNRQATGAEASASPPMLTIAMLREFSLRYIERLEQMVGRIRLVGLWGESFLENPRELLDIKKEGWPDQLQALDPDVTALGAGLFKKYADEEDMAVIMGLGARLIEQGPLEEIQSRVQWFINEAGQDGRFILFLNDVPFNTPPEHVHAAVGVAHGYLY